VPAEALSLNDIGRVTLRLAAQVPVEDYADSRRGGSFLLIDGHDGRTLAAGMVGATLPSGAPAPVAPEGDEDFDI
jgi:sulfate adenylyltransferase subunit 1